MQDDTLNTLRVAQGLRETALSLRDLSGKLAGALREAPRRASDCAGGVCGDSGGAGGGGSGAPGSALTRLPQNLLTAGLAGGDLREALQRTLAGFAKQLIGALSGGLARSAGGGIGGSLLGGLAGGGLSLLAGGLIGKLFPKRQSVRVDNVVRAEVLNFPRLTSLDFASNPASRLFGGRALGRGPAFSVEVSYRGGAEDVVAAKVARKLLDANSMGGIV